MVHPVIRLVCFFLLIIGLTTTVHVSWFVLVFLFFLLFKVHLSFSSIFPLLASLKWLFLPLILLHSWSMYESNELDFFLLQKMLNLIIIVLAAHLLHQTTSTEEMMTALYWFSLNKKNNYLEKLIVRLILVLETVKVVQELYTKTIKTCQFNKISEGGYRLFIQIFTYAETVPLRALEISSLPPPPWKQWLYPLVIVILITEEYMMKS